MDESLQQLSQLFQDDDAEAILQVLADLESQNPLSRSTSNNNIHTSRKRDAFYPPTAVMSGGIQNQPRVQAVQKHTAAAAAANSSGKTSAPAAASSDDAKPTAPFYYYKDYSKEIDPDPSVPVTAPGRIPNFPAKVRDNMTYVLPSFPVGFSSFLIISFLLSISLPLSKDVRNFEST